MSYAHTAASTTLTSKNITANSATTSKSKSITYNSSTLDNSMIASGLPSMPLQAVLMLLKDLQEGQSVYLLSPLYLQNWLTWALHQHYAKDDEEDKKDDLGGLLEETARRAALQYHCLPLPKRGMDYSDPGPVDSISLALQGHALILNPLATLLSEEEANSSRDTSSVQRNQFPALRSVSNSTSSHPFMGNNSEGHVVSSATLQNGCNEKSSGDHQNKTAVQCVAVPEEFYETLRRLHGVRCADFHTVSYQLPLDDTNTNGKDRIILQHYMHTTNHNESPRPVEFRRLALRQHTPTPSSDKGHPLNLMEKLLLQERPPATYLTVEVHPVKWIYHLVTTAFNADAEVPDISTIGQSRNFVLVSQNAPVLDALKSLIQQIQYERRGSVRVWSRWEYPVSPTSKESRYELIDMEAMEEQPTQTVNQWAQKHFDRSTTTRSSHMELYLWLELRLTRHVEWPLTECELLRRLQPGDWVDAQDVAAHWYEALVQSVNSSHVVVHYMGWASRWDAKLRRENQKDMSEAIEEPNSPFEVPSRVQAPAPLWSRSGRWRQRLQVGDILEVRDSSSIVERPKWYQGIVRKIGRPQEKPRDLVGGAALEMFPESIVDSVNNDTVVKSKPLLLLGLTQQILVQVDSEKSEKTFTTNGDSVATETSVSTGSTDQWAANPPHLRWVNLYGEEVCRVGTHLKEKQDQPSAPVTLMYEFDANRKPVEVMKSHPMHGSGFMRESLRGTPPAPGSVGLHNLGNSCFLNSTVQCLNHIEPLTQYFLQDKYSRDLNKRNPLGSGGNVAIAYASLLKKMWGGNFSVLVPRMLKQTVANFAPQFDNSYQHDSHEFCQFLMDGLHEDLNRVKTKPYVEELDGFGMPDEIAAIESWRKHLLRHDSVIVDHCQGMHRSHLTCPQCGRESIKFDVYSSISLPLPQEKDSIETPNRRIKLEDCVEKFMEAEQLDERDAYYCPNCRRHVCALKLIALWSVPDILILHLKRFTFDTCMSSGGMLRSKIDQTVEFPINGFDLTEEVLGPIDPEAPPIYNLFGVSEHIGPTANSGHYTATVRNSIDNQWYRCNDSHVGRTAGEASITGGAYLLFYQRSKGTSKWGGMYRAMKERGIDPYDGANPIDADGFVPVKFKKNKIRQRACPMDGNS